MSIDHISTTDHAHRLGADAQLDRFDGDRFAGFAGAPDEAALVLDGGSGGGLQLGAAGAVLPSHDLAVADPNWSPIFSDYGMMPLDNTKPHKTVAEAANTITRDGYHWNSPLGQALNITYSFRQDAPASMPNGTAGFSQFTSVQIAATQLELRAWSDVAQITFVQVSDADAYTNNATILYGNYNSGAANAAAFAYDPATPGNTAAGSIEGDVWTNITYAPNASGARLSYGPQTLLHETGHALGLEHPGNYDASDSSGPTYSHDATYFEDSRQYTVMSYFSETNTGGNFAGSYAELPLMDDIAAMQKLYGANPHAFEGDTTYGFNSSTGADYRPYYDASLGNHLLIFCAYDTGGNDTFNFYQYAQDATIDLNTGRDHFSSVGGLVDNISIYDGTVIENAIGGTGNDLITGNDANNQLQGDDGADTLKGGDGNDTLVGLAGADNLNGGNGDDILWIDKDDVVVTGGAGTDQAHINSDTYGATTFSLYDGRLDGQIENIWAEGSTGMELDGTTVANNIRASEGNDLIKGMEANDTLIGRAGADTIYGGTGDDTVYGGSSTDLALADGGDKIYGEDGNDSLNGGLGNDTIDGGIGNDTIFGGANDDDSLLGGAGNDSIDGGSGNDTVDGGDGNNTLIGGVGNDLIRVAAGNSTITGDAGTDELDVSFGSDVASVHQNGDGSGTVTWAGGYTTSYSTIESVDVTIGSSNYALGANGQIFYVTGAGSYTMNGGAGLDILVFNYATEDVSWSNSISGPDGNGYSGSFNNPYHTISFSGIDVFQISTGAGSDNINVGNATSTINTGAGNDVISTGTGVSNINGGAGYDGWNADLSATSIAINLNLVTGGYSGPGAVSGIEYVGTLASGSGADNITTGSGGNNELISTNAGNDTVTTYNGSDTVHMGAGTDTLIIDFSGDGSSASMSVTDNGASGYSGSLGTPYSNTQFDGAEIFKITTGGGNDYVSTSHALATINTGAGDDFINSGTAVDSLTAGSGYDGWTADLSAQAIAVTLDLTTGTYSGAGSASGFEYVGSFASGSKNDFIKTGVGGNNELISTNAGNDTVTTYNGSDTVHMGAGTDTLIIDFSGDGSSASMSVTDNGASGYSGSLGTPYNNTQFDGAEIFKITTSTGNDNISTGNSLATINTGAGNDFINSGAAVDNLTAGAGTDGWSADLSAQTAAITLDLGAGTYSGPGVASGFEYVGTFSSGSGADLIKTVGGQHNEVVNTNSGNDTVYAVDGSDTINLGAGTDSLFVDFSGDGASLGTSVSGDATSGWSGSLSTPYNSVTFTGAELFNIATSSGNDSINLAGAQATINTGAGDDFINSGTAVDSLTAGAGTDGWTADLSAQTTAISLDLGAGTYSGPGAASGFEYVGTFSSGSGADLIKTVSGNHSETVNTNGGNDTVYAVDGSDTINLGGGTDSLFIDFSGDGASASMSATDNGANGYSGSLGTPYNNVTFTGAEMFNITTGSGGDSINLLGAQATINTGAGADFINSGTAVDSIDGGADLDGWSGDLSATTVAMNFDMTTGAYTGPGHVSGIEYVGTLSSGSKSDGIKTAGGGHNESISTNAGNDTVSTIDGSDTVAMGAGTDTLVVDLSVSGTGIYNSNISGSAAAGYAGEFDDTYGYNRVYFSGVEAFQVTGSAQGDSIGVGNALATINTGAGDDFINSGTALDSLVAGTGTDGWSADLSAQTAAISLDLTTGVYSGPGSATGFEYVGVYSTGSGADSIRTTSGNHNESIFTNGGADTVSTVDGVDTVAMGAGTDTLIVDLSVSNTGIYTSNLAGSAAAGYAGEFDDTYGYNRVFFSGVEAFQFTGTAQGDNIALGNAVATINTGAGDDFINSGTAVDSLIAGTGSDGWSADLSAQTAAISLDLTTGVYSGPGSATGFEYLGTFSSGSGADFIKTSGGSYNETVSTNGGNDTVSTAAGVDTISMGAGSDTLIVDLSVSGTGIYTSNLTGSAAAGYAGEFDDTYGYNRVYFTGVETFKVTGSANADALITGDNADSLFGGAGADSLSAQGGNDSLDGGTGVDTMVGGLGDDTYVVDDATDSVVENAGEGTDTVQASVSYVLAANVENLLLTGAAASGTGNDLNNTITGNALANTLDGGAGIDTLVGGAGNDTYLVDTTTDTITELAGGGTDTIQSSVTYTCVANVEFLVLTGTADINGFGDSGANTITGNDGANSLAGGNGVDTLNGAGGNDTLNGGLGGDSLSGGLGDDTYIVDNLGDAVTEAANAGLDWVQAAIDYVLGGNVENLILTGAAVNGTGNILANEIDGDSNANSLVGGSGADTLNGAIGNDTLDGGALSDVLNGGTGADSMIGGTGNDTFTVDNAGDIVVELAGGGTDTVQSSITYTLGANVENLTLTGNTAINGTGNDANNTLKGSAKDNVLEGGLGDDVIVGGKGFDIASYAHATGSVTVSLGGGVNSGAAGADTISSVEGLTGSIYGDSLTGSSKGDVLDGGAGADTLTGGLGADVLTGGADADRFVFSSIDQSSTKTPDRITDLTNADLIDLHLIDANSNTGADDQFTLVSAFSHQAGQLVLSYSSATGQTLLQGDTDGDGKANFAITLDGNHADFTNFAY